MDLNGHLQPDDIIRGVRQRRKQTDPVACPVCGVTVRPADIEQHYAVEMERLHKLHISDAGQRSAKSAASAAGRSPASVASSSRSSSDAAGTSSASSAAATGATASKSGDSSAVNGAASIDPKECWSTYQRIKSNRQSRLKTKSRKRKSDDPICPVCNEYIADDINIHVEMCLRRNDGGGRSHHNGNHHSSSSSSAAACVGGSATTTTTAGSSRTAGSDDDDDDDISIDVESESFEEYEWAGQTRIRASSLLQGGYCAVGVGTSMQSAAAGDEDEDLNVDGDDSHVFGESQYGERDVIVPSASSNKEQTEILYLRKLVSGDSGLTAAGASSSSSSGGGGGLSNGDDQRMDVAEASTTSVPEEPCDAEPSQQLLSGGSKDAIIESLKTRLREYEANTRMQNKCKCLICMDEFRIPVVSICCWHVHCEECWLRTLGARKLCPQCNMITSPADLRRIYM